MATAAEAPGAGAALMHSEVAVRVKDQDRLQLDVEAKIGIPRSIYESAGGLRVRQHVNPLKKELQVPTEPPAWSEAFAHPAQPLVLDIGCGYGRFLLALSKAMPGHNMLGLEIRAPIIDRANLWAASLELNRAVLFLRGNATITLDHTLSSYPGSLDLACVQFPDPHFKTRHKKRRTVQKQMVEALGRLMAPGARVFLQSDVLEAAEHMRDSFEQHGSTWFAPCQQLHSGATFLAASEEQQGQGQGQGQAAGGVVGEQATEQQQQQQQGTDQQGPEQQAAAVVGGEQPQWRSQWAASGWLADNPLGVPTEREVLTVEQGLPVYRMMLRRI
ncbi:hypothetical protein D9Q98_002682 [Chlorella vulgaris]|uniref:tRNA (guanine(46)-N(7))-methyltransferase n=1 Tax=Chlorella vulgaris TaxID=3077 RepID=A0A9D4TTP9_CHLVU|nr:hypothetical protein D9Q98_002682 [Chlorella vulgaris]